MWLCVLAAAAGWDGAPAGPEAWRAGEAAREHCLLAAEADRRLREMGRLRDVPKGTRLRHYRELAASLDRLLADEDPPLRVEDLLDWPYADPFFQNFRGPPGPARDLGRWGAWRR